VEENNKPPRTEAAKPQEKVVTASDVDRSLREVAENLTLLRDSL
jgi:hypothetical protein